MTHDIRRISPDMRAAKDGGLISLELFEAIRRLQSAAYAFPSYEVAELPKPIAGQVAFVSNESGGAVTAFADGTNWRRTTDRAIVS